jgi:hypothetical protein
MFARAIVAVPSHMTTDTPKMPKEPTRPQGKGYPSESRPIAPIMYGRKPPLSI